MIIGARVRNCAPEEALDHVFGYTCLNDIASREQRYDGDQWLLGKSQDTVGPMGPIAVTRDLLDLGNTSIRCWVNGELRQDAILLLFPRQGVELL